MLRAVGGSEGSNPVYNSSVLKVRLCDRISIFISLLKKKKRKEEIEIHQRALFKEPRLRKWQNEVGFGLSELLQDNVNNLLLMWIFSVQHMQRGECAVLYTSVKHRSYRVQKSDLCGLRTAEILFFLCVIYILSQGFCTVFQMFTEVLY